MLRIVMDSAGDLPQEWISQYQIEIIPINVHMGDKVFLENVDLTIDQFYSWVKEDRESSSNLTAISPAVYRVLPELCSTGGCDLIDPPDQQVVRDF